MTLILFGIGILLAFLLIPPLLFGLQDLWILIPFVKTILFLTIATLVKYAVVHQMLSVLMGIPACILFTVLGILSFRKNIYDFHHFWKVTEEKNS